MGTGEPLGAGVALPPISAPPPPTVVFADPPAADGSVWVGVLALVAAAGIVAGVFAPFLAGSGFDGALIDGDWANTAALVSAALLFVGGLAAFGTRWGGVLAGAAGLPFLGLAVIDLSAAGRVVDEFSSSGLDLTLGVGFYAWALAAALALVLAVRALTQLGAPSGAGWVYALPAAGLALLAVGVLVPPDGFSFGELAFAGDGWSDASMVVLLGGLGVGVVALLAARSPMSSLFALGVAGPWVASWLVFAIGDRSGGLPVPFPDTPVLAGLAIALVSFAWVGLLWVGAGLAVAGAGAGAGGGAAATGLTAGAGAGVGALGVGQVITIVVCGASVLVAAGGTASAASADSSGGAYAALPAGAYGFGGEGEGEGDGYDSGSEDTLDDGGYVAEDPYEDGSYDSSDTDPYPGDTYTTEVCVEVACEDDIASGGTVEGYDEDVLTNVVCPSAIAADMSAAARGGDPGYLQARYEAGNFVIHVCTGPNGPIYHGQHIETGNLIVLPATGDVYGGFQAVNGDFTYFIDDQSLVISQGGALIQEDPVFSYEEY